VLTAGEARNLAELRDMVAKVIAVDDFAAAELARGEVHPHNSGSTQPEHIAAE
jgi:hypothetical protein